MIPGTFEYFYEMGAVRNQSFLNERAMITPLSV